MKRIAALFVGMASLVCGFAYASTTLTIAEAKPFPAHLSTAVFDVDRSCSYVGLGAPVAGVDGVYAVSMATPFDIVYRGVTPEKIRINALYDQANPLYGKQIALLGLVNHAPAVVIENEPNKLYLLRNPGTSSAFLLPSEVLKLHDDTASERIVQMVGFSGEGSFFAALTAPGSPFGQGDDSSLTIGTVQINEGQKTIELQQGTSRAVTIGSSSLKITNDLQSIGASVCMCVSEHLKTAYTGLQVVSGAGVGSGARAVLMGLDIPMAVDAAVAADSVVATSNVNKAVSIYQIDTMWTTTGLDYLVVVGGVETVPGDHNKKVYALPLVGLGSGYGTLAKKDSAISIINSPFSAKQVIGRAFSEVATGAGDLFTSTDVAAVVGGDVELPGPVMRMWVQKDAVFSVVAQDDALAGGVFSSQALFDGDGRITGWTSWAHAGGCTHPAVASYLDATNGVFYTMEGATWNDVTSVNRSEWAKSLWAQELSLLFSDDAHGIQGVVDFPSNHPAFSQVAAERCSLICCTGYGKVAFAQSGFTDGADCFRETTNLSSIERNSTQNPADILFWDSGVIAELGAIITADIVTDGTYSWLVVGGSNGAAVLCDANGHGWNIGALASGFANLPTDLVWRRFFSGAPVRKICANRNQFFLLTEESLERYDSAATLFLQANARGTLLVTSDSWGTGSFVRFSDVAVSESAALLATDQGLFRSGNAVDVRTSTSFGATRWAKIILPESMHSVTRLVPIAAPGIPSAFCSDERGGNVLAVSGSVGRSGTSVYRLACQYLAAGVVVSDDTFSLLPDCYMMQWARESVGSDIHRTYFVSRGDYRNHVATDGALWLMSCNTYAPSNIPAFVELLPQEYRTMLLMSSSGGRVVASAHSGGVAMGPLVRRSSNGSWLIGGSTLYGQQN